MVFQKRLLQENFLKIVADRTEDVKLYERVKIATKAWNAGTADVQAIRSELETKPEFITSCVSKEVDARASTVA